MKTGTRWSIWWLLVLLAALGSIAAGCDCDDDDDDNDDDAGDDDATDDDDDDDATDDDATDDDAADDDATDDDTVDDPPVITDTMDLDDTFDTVGPYVVETLVTDDIGVSTVELLYRVDGGTFTSVAMGPATKGNYSGEIPGQAAGGLVEYYILADDTASQTATDPADAPLTLFSFLVLAESTVSYDDDSAESSWSAGGEGSYMFLRVTPPAYPAYLRSVWYYCVTGAGREAEPFAIYDPTGAGTPPDIAGAIDLGDVFTPVENAWTEIDVSGVAELADPLESGDFYIGFLNVTSTPAWGWDESSTLENRVWSWAIGDSNWHHIGVGEGVVMYRAVVATP